jgi:predicted CopG family antitoxin
MPKAGFKSITVSDNVYNRFFETYVRTRRELELKGITSFSGYLTSLMEETMSKYEAFARHAPFMEKIDVDQNRITIKDNKRNRIAEVFLKDDQLHCSLDENTDCAHIGFVYSLPEFYNIITTKGIRISRPFLKSTKPKRGSLV